MTWCLLWLQTTCCQWPKLSFKCCYGWWNLGLCLYHRNQMAIQPMKSMQLPKLNCARQVKNNIKFHVYLIFFFFLIMREFFTGNLFLLVKESVLLSTLRSWTVCEWMWEKCGLTNGGTRHGFSTTTILQPMLPSRHNSFWPVNIWPWCPILCIH